MFRGATETNRFVATVYPGLPWLEHSLLAKVNHRRTCNAFWNGTSINFFQAGDGCNNSGRIFDVMGGLLGQSAPDAMNAAGFSDSPHLFYAGYDDRGEWFQLFPIGFGGILGV